MQIAVACLAVEDADLRRNCRSAGSCAALARFQTATAAPAKSRELPSLLGRLLHDQLQSLRPTVLHRGHAACVFIKRVEQPTDNQTSRCFAIAADASSIRSPAEMATSRNRPRRSTIPSSVGANGCSEKPRGSAPGPAIGNLPPGRRHRTRRNIAAGLAALVTVLAAGAISLTSRTRHRSCENITGNMA
jgi:hypothetical protein